MLVCASNGTLFVVNPPSPCHSRQRRLAAAIAANMFTPDCGTPKIAVYKSRELSKFDMCCGLIRSTLCDTPITGKSLM
jgi:hypothetical protein